MCRNDSRRRNHFLLVDDVANNRPFDLDQLLAEHIGDERDEQSEVLDQAVAVLIDNAIPENERASAFVKVMSELLSKLTVEQFAHFRSLAESEGQAAAMTYLASATRSTQPRQSKR